MTGSRPGSTTGTHRQRGIGDDGWVDVLLGLALCASAVGGWATSFEGYGWWVTALAATAVATTGAVLLAGLGFGIDALIIWLLVAYLVPAGPLVAGRVETPTTGTVADAITGTLDSWGALLGTHPPVDARGLALVPVYLLTLVGVGLTLGLALRSRIVGLPLLPAIGLLLGVLLLGRYEPASLLVQGTAFGALAVVWVVVRGHRAERLEVGSRRVGPARMAAAAALLVVCGAVSTLGAGATAEDDGRQVLRDFAAAYDVRLVRTPLDDFRVYTEQPPGFLGNVYDKRLLEVSGAPVGSRLRFAALDTYDGISWKADNGTDPARDDDRFLRISDTVDNPAVGRRAFVNVTVLKAWSLPWVPTVGSVQSLGFDRPGRGDRLEEVRFNPATNTAVMTDSLGVGDDYEFATVIADDRLRRSMLPSPDLDEQLFEISRLLKPASDWWSVGWTSAMDAVYRVAHTLREEGRYSDGATLAEARFRSGHSRQRLGDDFVLADPTAGNDEQYAAAMALFANRMAVPARVVVGAVVPRGGVIRGRDVQAWVEVRVADGSWRTLPTEEFMSTRPVEQLDPAVVPAGGGQRTFPDLEELPPPPEEQESPARSARDVLTDRDSWRWAVVLLALVGIVPGAKLLRRRRRLGAARATARYAGAWRELVDHARDLGHAVPVGLTRPAEARLLAEVVPDAAGLADEADRVVFGLDEPTEADAAAYWRRVRRARRHLGGARTPWRRVWAPFSLGSIRVAATQGQ